jgi:hypothetical protein
VKGRIIVDAGLAFFVFKRPKHTKRVLESIRNNNFKKIYIFQDGPRDERDQTGWDEVNALIRSVSFAETELHVSQSNLGCRASLFKGIDYVLERHEAIIVVEDDILLGDSFSGYMYSCLEKYKDDKNVYNVAACNIPLRVPDGYGYDVFFSYRFSCWGWGTWRDRWETVRRDYNLIADIYTDREKKKILDMSGTDLIQMYLLQMEGKINTWDIFVALSQINRMAVSVIPVKYLASNIGLDGDGGSHYTNKNSRYETEMHVLSGEIKFPPEISVDGRISPDFSNKGFNRAYVNGSYYNLLLAWVRLHQSGSSVAGLLKSKGIKSCVIYGAGEIAKLLIPEIEGEITIDSVLVMDKTAGSFCGYPLYEFSDAPDMPGKVIIITPVWDSEFIKYRLSGRFMANKCIGLDEIMVLEK